MSSATWFVVAAGGGCTASSSAPAGADGAPSTAIQASAAQASAPGLIDGPVSGCGEPSTAPTRLPTALSAEPEVLADAVLAVGEGVTFGAAELAVEMRRPLMWMGEGPPEPSPELIYRRGEATQTLRGLGPGETRVVDGIRVRHRWSEERDKVWVYVTDLDCPAEHEQMDRPEPGAPLWTWLSSRAIGQAGFGHAHSTKVVLQLSHSRRGPRISLQGNSRPSYANLRAMADLEEGRPLVVELGSARVFVEEVVVGAAPVHRGAEVGAAPTPVVHARVRYERGEGPPAISFPPGEDNPCGSPSPLRSEPRRLLEALPRVGSYHLGAGERVALGELALTMVLEPLPRPSVFDHRPPQALTRPIVRAEIDGEEHKIRNMPAVLRAGETIAWITREPGADPTVVAVEAYHAACDPIVRAPLPDRPTLLWLGTAGHTQVRLGDEGGDQVFFELLREDEGPPRVAVSSVSREHGSRSLTFAANADVTPVAVDTGLATIVGNWQVEVGAEASGSTRPPRWYAIAIPYIPHAVDATATDAP